MDDGPRTKKQVGTRQFGEPWINVPDLNRAKVTILPVSYEGSVTYGRGTGLGPAALLDASYNLEWYDEELGQETYRAGFYTYPIMTFGDGDSTPMVLDQVTEVVKQDIRAGRFTVMVGGEHSLTLGPVRAHAESGRGPFSVLQLDAHADLRYRYRGDKLSHACVMRRIVEIDIGIVQVGIRSLSVGEARFIKRSGLAPYYAHHIRTNGTWMDQAVDDLAERVYVSLDIDVLDPAIMPATGTPEPGGLDWFQLTDFLRLVAGRKEIIGLDVVELAPIPGFESPNFVAAKLVYRLLGYILGPHVV
ncbi:MAG: agmatinase [Deltaproteobacteria bacterium]|nr:agmatinase [Deltaproteobacteria bacterium]